MQSVTGISAEKVWIFRQLQYQNALRHLDEILSHASIPYMPIKGAYLICSGLASLIKKRIMVDIDLLVQPQHYEATIRLFSKHPLFERKSPDPWFFEYPFTFTSGKHRIELELHYQLNRNERFHLPTTSLFDRGYPQTATRILPSPEDALIILICHTLVHSGYGLPNSIYDEISAICSLPSFRWSRFCFILKSTGVEPYGFALLRSFMRKKARVLPIPAKHRWADQLFRLTPERQQLHMSHRLFYRGCIEPLFARHPIRLMVGWLLRTVRKTIAAGGVCGNNTY